MTEQVSLQLAVPDKYYTLEVNGEPRELFMSHGMLDALLRMVRDTDEIGEIYVDPDKRQAVLEALFAERSKSGRIITAVDVADLDIDIEAIDGVLQWTVAHLSGFFIRSMNSIARLAEGNIAAQQKVEAALTTQT